MKESSPNIARETKTCHIKGRSEEPQTSHIDHKDWSETGVTSQKSEGIQLRAQPHLRREIADVGRIKALSDIRKLTILTKLPGEWEHRRWETKDKGPDMEIQSREVTRRRRCSDRESDESCRATRPERWGAEPPGDTNWQTSRYTWPERKVLNGRWKPRGGGKTLKSLCTFSKPFFKTGQLLIYFRKTQKLYGKIVVTNNLDRKWLTCGYQSVSSDGGFHTKFRCKWRRHWGGKMGRESWVES